MSFFCIKNSYYKLQPKITSELLLELQTCNHLFTFMFFNRVSFVFHDLRKEGNMTGPYINLHYELEFGSALDPTR